MFGFGPATRIYVAAGATDMRKNFNGLYGLVRDHLGCDPESGHVFLFTNARRNRLKLLVYDGSGLWVCAKKLDGGRFRWPEFDSTIKKIVLSHEELTLLLGGIDLSKRDAGDGIARHTRAELRISYESPHKHCIKCLHACCCLCYEIDIVSETSQPAAMSTPGNSSSLSSDLLEQLKAQLPESLFTTVSGAIAGYEKQLDTKSNELQYARLKIQVLEEKLRLQRIAKYGPGSEKLSNLQLELLEFEPGVSNVEVVAESERDALPPTPEKEEEAQASWPPDVCPPIFPAWSG